jgi:hypothetical protein
MFQHQHHQDDGDLYLYETYRSLASEYVKEEEEPLDYSVLSVAVMTLGLILCVELFRHHLDQGAMGRPFFKTVLEGVYSECK